MTDVPLRLLLVGAIAVVAACGSGEGGRAGAGTDGADGARVEGFDTGSAASDPAPIRGGSREDEAPAAGPASSAPIPEGDLEAWVVEMRARLEEIELDPRASYRDVVSVYTTYHAAIARYYGPGGELTGDDHPDLAAAVQRQDSAFQELLDLTGTTDYIERTHLLHAIRTLRLAMEGVLDRARAAGVPLDPRSGRSDDESPAEGRDVR